MEPSTISLTKTPEAAMLPTALEPAKSRFQYFTFSKNYERAQLANSFAAKAPSPIVTALNVTRIAPAAFFAIDMFAQALESVLNAGADLLHCACSCLFDRGIVVVEAPKPTKAIEETSADKTTIQKIVDKTAEDDTVFTIGLPTTPPAAVSEETPTEQPTAPVAPDDVMMADPETPVPTDDVVPEEPIKMDAETPQPAAQNPKEAPKDGLDKYDDLLLVNDEPVVPEAPSNTTRNLLIGGGLAVAGGIGLYAAHQADVIPSITDIYHYFFPKAPEEHQVYSKDDHFEQCDIKPCEEGKECKNDIQCDQNSHLLRNAIDQAFVRFEDGQCGWNATNALGEAVHDRECLGEHLVHYPAAGNVAEYCFWETCAGESKADCKSDVDCKDKPELVATERPVAITHPKKVDGDDSDLG